jgi:dCTP deaminase
VSLNTRSAAPLVLPQIKTEAPQSETGILPRQRIAALIELNAVQLAQAAAPGQLQPASLDLRLGNRASRVRASFLPRPGETVATKLVQLELHHFDLTAGAVLETGCVYLVPLQESLDLPANLAAVTNPKSSTGRLDVFTRVIADGIGAFDMLPAGYRGPLYAEICPQTFPIIVRAGSRLSQIRFRAGLMDANARSDDLSVDLAGDSTGLVGYRAKRHTGVVDVDRPGAYPIAEFWEPIFSEGGRLILDPDQFYILASKEAVAVPPDQAAEMVPFNPLVGEFRVHYAGFFDPGFGYGAVGGTTGDAGARAVLEVRSHTVPFMLEHGQIIGRLVYEPLTALPDQLYGQGIGSHYQSQGLKLSKHFR